MERLGEMAERAAAFWAGLPPVPSLDLPAPGDPVLVTVGASILAALGLMGLVTGWADRRVARLPLLSALVGAALLAWVWDADRDAFDAMTVPMAFVEMTARVVR